MSVASCHPSGYLVHQHQFAIKEVVVFSLNDAIFLLAESWLSQVQISFVVKVADHGHVADIQRH